jgi:hypothetical protein
MYVKHGKGERVCALLPISWAKDFVYEKGFSKIKLNVKKCEIKILYRALCILLTNCSKIIQTLVGGSQLFKKQ